MPLLELKEVSKAFGGLQAVHMVSTRIEEGEIIGLIGPNGAGKTTLFNIVSGFYTPSSGNVLFKGEDITYLKPFQIACKGLTRTYQETNLFHNLTVERNILMGCHLYPRIGFFEQLFGTRSAREKERISRNKVNDILGELELSSLKDEFAKNLSHGHQRTLGVAISLATEPSLLLLDEPFGGMNAEETRSLITHLLKIHEERHITIVLVEHDMKAVMGLCNRIIVLNFGEKIAEGTPAEIQKNDEVIEAYLGVNEDVV